MNREIKFRAWDKAMKQFIVIGFHVFGETTLFNLIEMHCRENNLGKSTLDRLLHDIETTQFTGLHDKKWKEIYEGDICSLFSCNRPIIYKEGAFGYMTELDSKYAEFIHIRNHHFDWTDNQSKKIKVIGNIYENADLLNSKKLETTA